MSVIRLRVLEVLRDCVARLVPELEGHICAGHAEANHKLEWPNLSLVPVSWRFHPDQDGEVYTDLGPGRAVYVVGRHEALIQMRLGARTMRERARLEHLVTQVFVSQHLRPGVLVVRIRDCQQAVVAYEFDDTEWKDEAAFEREWYSIIEVVAQVPALVERGGYYTIEEIRSTFTQDLSTPAASLPAESLSTVRIDENGIITTV